MRLSLLNSWDLRAVLIMLMLCMFFLAWQAYAFRVESTVDRVF